MRAGAHSCRSHEICTSPKFGNTSSRSRSAGPDDRRNRSGGAPRPARCHVRAAPDRRRAAPPPVARAGRISCPHGLPRAGEFRRRRGVRAGGGMARARVFRARCGAGLAGLPPQLPRRTGGGAPAAVGGALRRRARRARGRVERWSFQPFWLRAELEAPDEHRCRLTLSSRGTRVSLGAFLAPEERRALYRTLREALDGLRSSPSTSPMS